MKIDTSIIIGTYNHCDDLLIPCLLNIVKSTPSDTVEIIVVANGCTDGTRNFLDTYTNLHPKIKYLWHDEALGFAKAYNEGIKASQGEYAVLLNNDVKILEWGSENNWLNMMKEFFDKDPAVGIVGSGWNDVSFDGRKFLLFYCVMIKRGVFDKIGLLDESFGVGGFEDADFCFRAEDAGWKMENCYNINPNYTFPIYHSPESTVRHLENWNDIFYGNLNKFREKHKVRQMAYGVNDWKKKLQIERESKHGQN